MPVKFIIYCHTSPSGRKYVGITSTTPEKRFRNGRGYEANIYFSRAIQKYGWENIKHEVLFSDLTAKEAKVREAKIISDWNLTDRRYGYNIREGGDGSLDEESRRKMSFSRIGNKNSVGRTLSRETRKKISNSLKEYFSTHNNPFKGRHHSDETKKLLSLRVFSDETKAKMSASHADVSGAKNPSAKGVVRCDLNGNVLQTYPYAKLAATDLHLDLSSIIKCCRGKAKTCGGYKWKYADD